MAESLRSLRDPIAQRPDPEALLRIAIRERDGLAAARLVQQWVHRRGLRDLERFQQELVLGEDPEAAFWLRRQWDDPLADPPSSAPSAPATPGSPAPSPAVVVAADPAAPAPLPSPAAVEPPSHGTESLPPLGESLLGESFTEPLSEELRILLATPLEDPFTESAPRTPRAPAAAEYPLPEPTPEFFLASDVADPAGDDDDPSAPAAAASGRDGRGTLSRIRARMRGYVEDAFDALHRVAHPSSPEDDPSGQASAAMDPADPSPSTAFASPSPDRAGTNGQSPLGAGQGAAAAPPPTTLADLRSWLPDADGDLPRAS